MPVSPRAPNWSNPFSDNDQRPGYSLPLRSSHWKYVDDDDVTISEVSSLGEVSSLQNDIDCILQWAQQNNMNLNPKKCKIMAIRPLKNKPVSPMLSQ